MEEKNEGAAAPSSFFRNLTSTRMFICLVPDIKLTDEVKNNAYMMVADLPVNHIFVSVLSLNHPLHGILGSNVDSMLPSTVAYGFLIDPDDTRMERHYISGVVPNQPFSWSARQLEYQPDALSTYVMGVSVHSGLPIMHVDLVHSHEKSPTAPCVQELEEYMVREGYRLIPSVRYDFDSLMKFYASSPKGESDG